MRILFDHCTPAPLRRALAHHNIETAFERGWHTLNNGELLGAAEAAGFELLVTTDQNLPYQQNPFNRKMAVLVLKTTSWRRIRPHLETVANAVDGMGIGQYRELSFPK